MPQPISNITLYNCRLDRTGHKTIDFSSALSRDNYFSSNSNVATIYSTINNATYVREDKTIKVGINAELLDNAGVNYCRYNNPQSGTSQYKYCFIDDIEYIAPNTSLLHIHTDVFITNQGSINLSDCAINVRSNATEFTADGNGGIYPTNVLNNVGYCNPICISSTPIITTTDYTGLSGTAWVLIACSESLNKDYIPIDPTIEPADYNNGLPNSYYWYCLDPTELDLFKYFVKDKGDSNKIISIYYVPRNFLTVYGSFDYSIPDVFTISVTLYNISPSTSADFFTVLGYNGGYIMPNGYKPKDQNLLRYPYCYAKVTDRKGHELILKPELLGTDNSNNISIYYKWVASIGDSCGVGFVVQNYMQDINSECCFNIADFPTLPWFNDAYYTYMALNKNSLTNMYIQSAISVGSAIYEKNYKNIYSSLTGVIEEEAKQADLRNYPDTVKGGATNNIAFNSDQRGLYIELWSIPYETAETIDRMLEQSGDVVTIIDKPSRKMLLYDVVQTVNSNVYGTIPKNEKEEIDRLYNEGLTIWHIDSGGVYNVYDLENNTKL